MTERGFYLRPVEAAGVPGRYAAGGAGPPVVLLASALARARPYRPTAEALARGHRVYLVEPPGCGRAARLPTPWTLGQYAGWVAALLEGLGLAGATVVGHSHAGGVAVVLAARYGERVGRVVVAGGVGTYQQSLPRSALGRVRDTIEAEFPLAAREWSVFLQNGVVHTRNHVGQIRASLTADLRADAARVGVPALVAWGDRDHTVPPAAADAYARLLPRAEVYWCRGGTHCWPITRPAEFAARVTDFIRRTGGRA
jgi:pimeloyl-ACP methyl ester carboxylesterase